MVKSGITISNQERLRRYNAERAQEERNDVIQQAELYGKLAEENALDAQAASLARLAKNVFKKSFDNVSPELKTQVAKVSTTLLGSIKSGKLDQLVKSLVAIPDNLLNPRQKVIKGDLNNPEFKRMLNEAISEEVAKRSTSEQIEQVIKEMVAGSEGVADFEEMVSKSRSGSVGSVDSIGSNYSLGATTVSTGADYENLRPITWKELSDEIDNAKTVDDAINLGGKYNLNLQQAKPHKSSIISAIKAIMVKDKKIIDIDQIPKASLKTIKDNIKKLSTA